MWAVESYWNQIFIKDKIKTIIANLTLLNQTYMTSNKRTADKEIIGTIKGPISAYFIRFWIVQGLG